MVLNSEAEILNISKLLWDEQGHEWFTADSECRKRMSGGDPRTGTFYQMRVTMGDTACSVNGVLVKPILSIAIWSY